jgi:hypothetical protein
MYASLRGTYYCPEETYQNKETPLIEIDPTPVKHDGFVDTTNIAKLCRNIYNGMDNPMKTYALNKKLRILKKK